MRPLIVPIFLCVLTLLVAACATPHGGAKSPAGDDGTEPVPVEQVTPAAESASLRTEDARGGAPLSPEVLYHVLAGELAGQDSHLDEAFSHYLRAAQLSRDPSVTERATRIAAFSNDREAALEAASLWIEIAPEEPEPRRFAALFYIRNGDIDSAMPHLTKLIELSEQGGGEGFIRVASLLAGENNTEISLNVMTRLLAEYQRSPESLYAFSLVAVRAGDLKAAETALREALSKRPGWSEARVLLSRVLVKEDDMPGALALLRDAVSAQPDDLEVRRAYAGLLVEAKEFAVARDEFVILNDRQPGEPETLFALGMLCTQLDEPEKAVSYFEALAETGKRADEAYFYLGQIRESMGDNDAALEWYARVSGDTLRTESRLRMARLYGRAGHIGRARQLLEGIRAESPKLASRTFLVEGSMLRDAGKHQESMDVYDRGLEVFPGDTDLLYARALQAVNLGRYDILERDLLAILAQDADHADALNALGYTLADQGKRLDEAGSYIEKALALKPDSPAVLDSMGWLQYRLGNYEQALAYLQRANSILTDSEISAHLGEVLWVTGQRQEARAVWRRALEADPDNTLLLEVMNKFQAE